MSEDRTQEASPLRRQQARERGHVARSPELTGAAGLLTAAALLGVWGDDLTLALIELVRAPWLGDLDLDLADPAAAVAHLRVAAGAVAGPLLKIAGGSALAAVAAHQGQVGGLFNPGRLAPDLGRLWNVRFDEDDLGAGVAARLGRGAWSLGKAAVVIGAATWAIRAGLADWPRLFRADPRGLATAVGGRLQSAALGMALACAGLGLVDYVLQRRRFASGLRLTPEQSRQDLRSTDGDPAIRRRRVQQARALRGDAPELLVGASLAVVGDGGLIAILGGGPPPRKVSIRATAHKATGHRLRRSADRAGLAVLANTDLARALARVRTPVLPAELLVRLARQWPAGG